MRMLWAVTSLTFLFNRFHGDPPVQGPANTQSLALRMHLRNLALPKFDIRLSSSVMVTTCINLNRSLRCILVMMLCVSAHMRSKNGISSFISCNSKHITVLLRSPPTKSYDDLWKWYVKVVPFFRCSTIWISQSLSFLVSCFSLYWWAINMSSNGIIFMLPSKVQVTTEFWHDALSSTSDPLSNRLLISALEMILNVVVPVQNSFLLFVRSMLFPANLHESLIVLPLDWNTWYVSRSSRNRFNLHGKKSASLGTNILLLGVLCTLTSVTSSFHTHSSLQSSFLGFFLALLDGVGLRNMSLDTLVWATSPPAKTMRRRFGSLFSVGYGSSLMSGAPVGGCPIGRLPQPELPPWTTRRSVLITRAVPRGAAWMVVGWSPMDWWQNNWSAPMVSLGYFWTSIWRDGTDTAGPGRSCDAGGRDETCPERHAAAAVGSPSVDWWYWKQARSTHWSKRSCCWTGWARSSTLIHLPWVNIQVLRKQSLGNDKPLGRFRK